MVGRGNKTLEETQVRKGNEEHHQDGGRHEYDPEAMSPRGLTVVSASAAFFQDVFQTEAER